MGTYDVAANLQQNHASFKTLPPRVPNFFVVAEVSIAIPAQIHRTIQIAFDKTEPAYYSRTMTTPQNHTTRRQPHARNMQPADRVTPRLQPSPVILLPNRRARQETMPNSRSAKFDRMQHNPTECHTMQRKLVHARTRARQRRSVSSLGMDCAQVAADSWSRRPRTVIPIDRTKPPVPQDRTAIM